MSDRTSANPSLPEAKPLPPATAPSVTWGKHVAPYPSKNPWWPDKTEDQYAVSFANATGESAFGPWNAWSGSGWALGHLENIAVDPLHAATQRNIYRRSRPNGGTAQPAILVGVLSDNTTTVFQEGAPPPPTAAQLAVANTNIANLMAWLTQCHNFLEGTINEVFSNVTESPTNDPGQTFVYNIIDDMLWGVGGIDFPGSAFFSAFIANFFWNYATDPPPSLQGAMAGVWERFDQSFIQALIDLAVIKADLAASWNTTWTNPANSQITAVWSFASPEFVAPPPDSVAFEKMIEAAMISYRLGLTQYLLPMKWSVQIDPKGFFQKGGDYAWIESYLAGSGDTYDAYYWTYTAATGGLPGCPQKGIDVARNFLGTGPLSEAPTPLCQWLFRDDGYGRITNVDGIATRHDIFCNWKLQNSLPQSAPNCDAGASVAVRPGPASEPASSDLKEDRRRADAWVDLFRRTNRQEIERQLIEKSQSDPDFLLALIAKPKESIEKFVGLKIPDSVEIEVIQERPTRIKMVLPLFGEPT